MFNATHHNNINTSYLRTKNSNSVDACIKVIPVQVFVYASQLLQVLRMPMVGHLILECEILQYGNTV
jgi:hypothetical protein